MAERYLAELFTADVLRAQERAYGRSLLVAGAPATDALGPDEAEFVASRDSFYLGTVSADGWPYVQHRGGPPGFLRALDGGRLGFADLRGNRQLISTGNVAGDTRVSLFLMDYPGRRRLKILGRARILPPAGDPELAARLIPECIPAAIVERLWLVDVVSYDWNCPKYITPRYTTADVAEVVAPLRARIADLEAALARNGRDG